MISANDFDLFEQSLRRAIESHSGRDLDSVLGQLGWAEALEADPYGAVAALFPWQGRANANSSALALAFGRAMGVDIAASQAVVLPRFGSWEPPGRLVDGRLTVNGLCTTEVPAGVTVVVPAETDRRQGAAVPGAPVRSEVVLVTSPADGLLLRAVEGIDPSSGLIEVTRESVPCAEVDSNGGQCWDAAVSLARVALAHEMIGSARAMLDLACRHALDRVQFGKPIARFQAVRHRLAESLVAIESAEALLAAGRTQPFGQTRPFGQPHRSDERAAMAKAASGRAARKTASHCQQVLAGIGFTAEHPFHRYFKRVLVLDELFGSSKVLTEQLGAEVLSSRRLPAPVPL